MVCVHNGISHKEFNSVVCIKTGETDSMVIEISQTERQAADGLPYIKKGENIPESMFTSPVGGMNLGEQVLK